MAINIKTRKLKRKLPTRNVIDPELVSSAASASLLNEIIYPTQHDRVIFSQLWDGKESTSNLPHVILGITNQKKQHSIPLGIQQKSYIQRLKENSAPLSFDLSAQSIIPISITNNMSRNQYTKSKELNSVGSVECESVECESVECESVECESVECESVECESVESEAVDCELVEYEPVEYKQVEYNDTSSKEKQIIMLNNTKDISLADNTEEQQTILENDVAMSYRTEYTPLGSDDTKELGIVQHDISETEDTPLAGGYIEDSAITKQTILNNDAAIPRITKATPIVIKHQDALTDKLVTVTEESATRQQDALAVQVTMHNVEVLEQKYQLENMNSVMQAEKELPIELHSTESDEDEDEDEDEDDEWMDSISDNNYKQEKIYQSIFDMMSVTPIEDIKKHNKQENIKAFKSADWLEDCTNIIFTRKQQKKRKIKRAKLVNRLERPYIIKKKIKSYWHVKMK